MTWEAGKPAGETGSAGAGDRAHLSVSIGHFSSAGRKDENQDFHGAYVPLSPELETKGVAVCIADGISSSALGAVAAETAVKAFLADYYCTSEAWSVRTSGERVISATNSWMYAQNRRKSGGPPSDEDRDKGLVSTFTAIVFKSRLAHIFHIGDACVDRVTGTSIERLTDVHRVCLGGGETFLSRALGMDGHVEIEYRQMALQAGDLFIIRTDGVHDHVSDFRLQQLLASADDLDEIARSIGTAAFDSGSADNLTVQMIRIDSLPRGEVEDLLVGDLGLPPAPLLIPGRTFEGYAIQRELYSGARNCIYLARDVQSNSRVAIKVPSTAQAEDPQHIRALMLEDWVARRLDHPHLVRAAFPRGKKHAYVVTDYVEGQTLAEWMSDRPRRDLATVRSLIRQIATGLHALHRKEILHRDIRPHNIMVDGEGTLKIIDFGSVQVAGLDDVAPKDFEDAAFAGTEQYSAPELYRGERASAASDLYSLGVIAYQLLTSQLPYGPRAGLAKTRSAQRRLMYVPVTSLNPSVPEWMDAAIQKAVKVDPAQRYQELSEFVYDLSHPNVALTAPDPVPWLQRQSERIWQVACGILLVALLLSLLGQS